ncbi:MAG: hypothetical protein GX780_02320, partial [Campylobacteraceae bacterium]|nr:hypothetical protein [Campylobacteraceae bacterium]
MILAFEFNTRASHGVLEGFLADIVASFDLPLDLRREKEALCLFVEGEEDLLLKFSDFLSQMLPVSIFVQGFKVSVVEKSYGTPVALKSCELFLPFSPQMVKSVIDEKNPDFYNPFITPSVGIGLEAEE